MAMLRVFVLAAGLSFLVAGFCSCSGAKAPDGPATSDLMALVPETSSQGLDGWHLSSQPSHYAMGEENTLYDFVDGAAELYLEYGFEKVVVADFAKGDSEIQVQIFKMKDPGAAFGYYSTQRNGPSATPLEIGTEGVLLSDMLYFWKGQFYVVVIAFTPVEGIQDTITEFAKAVSVQIGSQKGEIPSIFALLPAKGRVARSEVFARGKLGVQNAGRVILLSKSQILGMVPGDEAGFATYDLDGNRFEAFVARFKSDVAARKAFTNIRAALEGKHVAEKASESMIIVRAQGGLQHGIARDDTRLVGVFGVNNSAHLGEFLGQAGPGASGTTAVAGVSEVG